MNGGRDDGCAASSMARQIRTSPDPGMRQSGESLGSQLMQRKITARWVSRRST